MLLFCLPAPPLAAITIDVKTKQSLGAISPYVYGTNESDWSASGKYLTLGRQGGNRMTAYNWENNASNAGSDWFNQNDNFLGGGETPGEVPRAAAAGAIGAGKAFLATIPMAGYVAADKSPGGDVNGTPNYLSVRFRQSLPKKSGAYAYPPNLQDGVVYQDEFVKWFESKFPKRASGTPIFYALDNEPDLWANTHSRIHEGKVTYAEMVSKTTATATAIKAVASKALVFGFVSYGFAGFRTLQDAPDANGRDFIDYYLASMAAAEKTAKKRLLDVLDLHWYPEAQGGGARITGNDVSAAAIDARVQAPRSLWDPTYTEASWITQWVTAGPIELIPSMRRKIASKYPKTKLAFTEYNYGASNSISGGVAQADALGVFGREGVFAACYWPLQGDNSFVHGAFDAFRNYDGKGGRFGDTSLSVTMPISAVAKISAYASKGSAGTILVLINKTTESSSISLTLDATASTLKSYTLAGQNPHLVSSNLSQFTKGKAASLTLPAMSVSTIVLK